MFETEICYKVVMPEGKHSLRREGCMPDLLKRSNPCLKWGLSIPEDPTCTSGSKIR